ncbi:EPIDERMAL PATTERNING FACTOR-like protein 6 [Alnus glutinosa]|uniref:EPIDERMAL PATTERNING FACTOR-like protein 6 n=1 Tax=Alnus glutinosa TaxID=3517 RepID=UPI002D7663E1|nr:EPIDERMAL PATTERNING FACTOR-like protein 6 [Alnus glutinosa]
MKKRTCYFLMAILQIMTCVSVTSRPLESHDAAPTQGQIPHFPQAACDSKQGLGCIEGEPNEKEDTYRWLSRLGSRPPSCRQKCEGCIPCYPTQTPTTTDHIGVQYANYEPVGWKCKCGTSFFNP